MMFLKKKNQKQQQQQQQISPKFIYFALVEKWQGITFTSDQKKTIARFFPL